MTEATATLSTHNRTTEEHVRMIKAPEGTDTWVPIPHGQLIDEVDMALHEMGLQIDPHSRQFGLPRDGGQMFGVYHLLNHDSQMIDQSGKPLYSLALGLRNSIDKSLSAAVCFGSRVFVCDNLAMSGEETIARKHTKFILRDLPVLVREALGKFQLFKTYQDKLFMNLSQTFIEQKQVHDVICKAMRADAIPATWIPRVLNEWDNPSHGEFRMRTAWSLFNAVTEVMKPTFAKNPLVGSERTILLTQLFQQEFVTNMENINAVVPQ